MWGGMNMRIIDTPIEIQGIKLKNRLVMPPMATARADTDGKVSDAVCAYYDEKTKGGWIGLVICEHSYIMQEGKAGAGQVSIAKDEDIEGLQRLVNTIHANQTRVFAQISHAGQRAKPAITGMEATGPDTMSEEHIHEVVEQFAKAAFRAKQAGFDGVEIHCAHGYLLNQFYSPLANHRTDAYGKDRLRIHKEVVKAVREAVGPDFLIAFRLGACDDQESGNTIEDAVKAAETLAHSGIDLLDVSGGMNGFMRPGHTEQGFFQDISEAIKAHVDIPVLLTGGITDINAAENLLEHKKADLIGVGRAILKDSSWAEKAMS